MSLLPAADADSSEPFGTAATVAGAYGSRAVACVLIGTGSDGAMGVSAIKARGGTVIAGDPEPAVRGMPDAVFAAGAVDFILPVDEIARVIRG